MATLSCPCRRVLAAVLASAATAAAGCGGSDEPRLSDRDADRLLAGIERVRSATASGRLAAASSAAGRLRATFERLDGGEGLRAAERAAVDAELRRLDAALAAARRRARARARERAERRAAQAAAAAAAAAQPAGSAPAPAPAGPRRTSGDEGRPGDAKRNEKGGKGTGRDADDHHEAKAPKGRGAARTGKGRPASRGASRVGGGDDEDDGDDG